MEIHTATIVDIGTRYDHNDDRALVGHLIYDHSKGEQILKLPFIAAVCDGVGGYNGGGYAAGFVLSELAKCEADSLSTTETLANKFDSINRRLCDQQSILVKYSKMRTTIAGVIFGKERMMFFHAGDSRVYRFDGKYLSRITTDHSVVQEMIDNGILSYEESFAYDGRNIIRRCLGSKESQPVEISEVEPSIQEGEMYLLCTDGLWDCVRSRQIKDILKDNSSLLEKAEKLVQAAKDNGSQDNITVCICESNSQ